MLLYTFGLLERPEPPRIQPPNRREAGHDPANSGDRRIALRLERGRKFSDAGDKRLSLCLQHRLKFLDPSDKCLPFRRKSRLDRGHVLSLIHI